MIPVPVVTAEQMRLLDQATIASGHASGGLLMERAGVGVVAAMECRYGSLLGLRVLVLCGTGNNGGDGFVAARALRARGAEAHIGLLGDLTRVKGDALSHLARLEDLDMPVRPIDSDWSLAALMAECDGWDFAIDALLGTGAHGAPEGIIAAGVQAMRELDERGTRVVAVDVPTGVDADTGAIARRAVRADLTVTFGAPKRGHFLYPGRAFVGSLEVVDIGLDSSAVQAAALPVSLATTDAIAALLPTRDPRAHKTSVGRVLVVGGAAGLTGAVVLAARAAMRAGAGYVQCAIPASLLNVFAMQLLEPMALPMPETASRSLGADALEPILELARRADVLAIGCGMSRDPVSAELARRLVDESPCPMVIDADALDALGDDRRRIPRRGNSERVMTPHLGEMSRLTGLDTAALEAGRIDRAREWAERWQSVLVLKGAPTVVAAPDGKAMVNPTGNPGMATAGSGDVLTGIIAALIAQGVQVLDAAQLGVYVHGMAGDLAALERGQMSLIASDLIDATPRALLALVRARAG